MVVACWDFMAFIGTPAKVGHVNLGLHDPFLFPKINQDLIKVNQDRACLLQSCMFAAKLHVHCGTAHRSAAWLRRINAAAFVLLIR